MMDVFDSLKKISERKFTFGKTALKRIYSRFPRKVGKETIINHDRLQAPRFIAKL